MPRIRLIVSAVASLEDAAAAVAAGADAIGLDPGLFPQAGLAGSEDLAAIALALPPTVTPILITPALTASTVAQQVDAAAALAVRLTRPFAASEYPGLKRIIRGRKIIQSIDVADTEAAARIEAYGPLADALHLTVDAPHQLPACRDLAALAGLPWILRLTDVSLLSAALALRPHAVDLVRAVEDRFDLAALSRQIAAFVQP